MKHVKIEAFDLPDAWFQAISEIWFNGEIFNVGHGSEETDTKKLDVTIHVKHPENTPLVSDKAPTDMKHCQEYGLTYLWSDYLGEHPYTYGWRLRHPVDQVEEVVKAMIDNPNNRQLTMTIRIPEDAISYRIVDNVRVKHEPPCLTMMDFEVLDGKVNLTCYFRSWDAFAGMPENIVGIFMLLQAVVDEVNSRSNLNLKTGEMMFHSKNCHIYKRCYPFVEKILIKDEKERKVYIQPKSLNILK